MKRTDEMKSVTFSIPAELNNMLHSMVERRGLSRFVAQALEQALSEKKNALKQAYAQASKDPDRLKTIKEWEALDAEGWHD
jgi:metal-responsive CopG/Arc/MetJ family transcriptional regulator